MDSWSNKGSKLNIFAKNITSQHGEDGILEYILQNIPEYPKVCVDIGAWDGKNLSNIYTLWHDRQWKGILIEANEQRFKNILRDYGNFNIIAFNQMITPKEDGSIDSLFRQNNIDREVGVLSIDIDSFDYYVWKYMEYVNTKIIIIEHNHTIPGYIDYHDPEGDVFLRSSAKSLERLGKQKGFKLVACTLTNSIFIKDNLFNSHYFPDMPVEFLFDYSSCCPVKLSANTGTTNNNIIDVFNGAPSKLQRRISLFKRIYCVLTGKTFKKPSQATIECCAKAGIYIL